MVAVVGLLTDRSKKIKVIMEIVIVTEALQMGGLECLQVKNPEEDGVEDGI